MKRLVIVYSPRSTKFSEVERGVLEKARKLQGWMVLKFEVVTGPVQENAARLAEILRKGDLVLAAGGDGTATMAMNAVIKSGKTVTFACLPFGNFNDFPEALGNLSFQKIIKRFEEGKYKVFYPLKVEIDQKFYTWAGMYFSIGLMAEATEIFDWPKNRKRLSKAKNRLQFAANKAFLWYLKNKWRKDFLPRETKLNEEQLPEITTDYLALNGVSIAGLIPGEGWMFRETEFWSGTMMNRSFWRAMFKFIRAMEGELPGKETTQDELLFRKPTDVFVHVEGEGEKLTGVKTIKISKGKESLRVIAE